MGPKEKHPGFNSSNPLIELEWAVSQVTSDLRQHKKPGIFARAASRSGILIPAGGALFLANAAALVKVIRQEFQCTTPVEVAFWGKEEAVEVLLSRIEVRSP